MGSLSRQYKDANNLLVVVSHWLGEIFPGFQLLKLSEIDPLLTAQHILFIQL